MSTQHLHPVEQDFLLGAVGGIFQWQRLHELMECAAECEMLAYGDGHTSVRPKTAPCRSRYGRGSLPVFVHSQHADHEFISEVTESIDPVWIRLTVEAWSLGIGLLGQFGVACEVITEGGDIQADLGDDRSGFLAGSLGRDSEFQQYMPAIVMVIGDVIHDRLPAVYGFLRLLIPAAGRESAVAADSAQAKDVSLAAAGNIAIEAAILRLLGLRLPLRAMGCEGNGEWIGEWIGDALRLRFQRGHDLLMRGLRRTGGLHGVEGGVIDWGELCRRRTGVACLLHTLDSFISCMNQRADIPATFRYSGRNTNRLKNGGGLSRTTPAGVRNRMESYSDRRYEKTGPSVNDYFASKVILFEIVMF